MDKTYPIGKCEQMCPEEEIKFREREGLLHSFEILAGTEKNPKADRNKTVKEFSRSAAGRTSQDEKNLRTVNALLLTVNYLLHDVATIEYLEWNVVYDYIQDRLRAARQDIVIQSFPRPDTICILQPIVRFYTYSSYRLCEEPIEIFDPALNRNHLLECLKRLLCLYDDSDNLISKFNLEEKHNELRKNILYANTRPIMEGLYLVLNLGNTIALDRALNLPKIWRTSLVLQCFNISLEYWRGNYIRVCKMMPKLPPLLFMCGVLHLPLIRKKCLKTMSLAYSSKNLVFPARVLEELLLYNSVHELLDECQYYGVPVQENNITFSKTCFNSQKPEMPPKHSKYVDSVLEDISLPDLLLYDE